MLFAFFLLSVEWIGFGRSAAFVLRKNGAVRRNTMRRIRNARPLRTVCLTAVVPLLVGLAVYILCDPHTLISAALYRMLPDDWTQAALSMAPHSAWLRFCRNYLCDACWAFALESCVYLLLRDTARPYVCSFCIADLFAVLLESAQMLPRIPGTFDVLDVVAETIAIGMAGLQIYILEEKQ